MSPFQPEARVILEDLKTEKHWDIQGTLSDDILRVGPFPNEECAGLAVAGLEFNFEYRPKDAVSHRTGSCTVQPAEREDDKLSWTVPMLVVGPIS